MQDFFLVSTEGIREGEPRRCSFVRRLRSATRDDLMLVNVNPPVWGENLGLQFSEAKQLVLASRHRGSTLFPIAEWPCNVYCLRLRDIDILEAESIPDEALQIIDWGRIYATEEEAKRYQLNS